MKTLWKIWGVIVVIAMVPLTLLLAVLLPIINLSNAFEIIRNGVGMVDAEMISVTWALCLSVYITMRFRNTQWVYFAFPSLFEQLKLLLIACFFTSVGTELLNQAFREIDSTKRLLGVTLFITSLVIWRVVLSLYYTKRPIVPFLEKKQEKLRNIADLSEQ